MDQAALGCHSEANTQNRPLCYLLISLTVACKGVGRPCDECAWGYGQKRVFERIIPQALELVASGYKNGASVLSEGPNVFGPSVQAVSRQRPIFVDGYAKADELARRPSGGKADGEKVRLRGGCS